MQWLMLQQKEADDFVVATGRTETVRKFIEICADFLGWGGKNKSKSIIWERGMKRSVEEQILMK